MRITDVCTGASQGLSVVAAGTVLGPRARTSWEMLWFQRGSGVFTLDHEQLSAPEGSMALVPPAKREFCRWDKHQASQIAYFHFTFEASPVDWPAPYRWQRVRKVGSRDLSTSLFEFIQTHAPVHPGTPPAKALALAVETLLCVHIVGPSEIRPPAARNMPEPVYRTLQWIAEVMQSDPSLPISLNDLSDAAGVTPKHLCRLFQQSLQCSPVEAAWVYRLTLSLIFLREPVRKISEISEILGFANPFHYSRRFRNYFGEPPSALRQKMIATGYNPPLPPWPFM